MKVSINAGAKITVLPKEFDKKLNYIEATSMIIHAGNDETWGGYIDELNIGDIGNYAKYNQFIKIKHIFDTPHKDYGYFIAVKSSWEEANNKIK